MPPRARGVGCSLAAAACGECESGRVAGGSARGSAAAQAGLVPAERRAQQQDHHEAGDPQVAQALGVLGIRGLAALFVLQAQELALALGVLQAGLPMRR